MKHSTKKPTAEEQARLDAVHALPCLACAQNMERAISLLGTEPPKQPFMTEAHHLVDKGYRKHSGGHMATVNLCGWHHSGLCLDGLSVRQMHWNHGPSLKHQKKEFVIVYGSERKLLDETDALIASNREFS